MAKRVSPFADDFQRLSKTAESAVQLVREQENKSIVKVEKNPKLNSETKAKEADKGSTHKSSSKADSVKVPLQKQKKRKPREWGKPIAIFNTRIPQGMYELLDDLVYQLRKKGKQKSKQDLAQEAIEDLLKKHNLL